MGPTAEAARVVVSERGKGRVVRFYADEIEIKAQGDEVDVCEIRMTAGSEPPLHVHEREAESFYVLEGAVTFFTGDGEVRGEVGTFVYVPRLTPHTYAVDSGVARVLVTTTPGGFLAMFDAVGERFGGEMPAQPAPDHGPILGEVLAGYGIRILGPNPRHV
jgi:mannose-6-phosphate isomerase-like protein (cupin superfamily)